MSLPKQIRKVQFEFVSGTGVLSARTISIQDMEIKAMHENPLGNPTYSKSLNGFLVPYSLASRVKFNVTFNKMVGTDTATTRDLFNDFITYHGNQNVNCRFYYKYEDQNGTLATGASDRMNVVLDSPVEMVQKYQSQIGSFAPSISLIAQEMSTSIPSGLQGV